MEAGAQAARSRALAVLRVRSRALAVALLPAAVAVVLLAGGATGRIGGGSWDVARWILTAAALLVLLAAAGIALVVARARPAVSPTVPIAEESAPDLYRLVRDLADRLDVPAPSAIALTPDCDSWLEDRTHPAHGPPRRLPLPLPQRGAAPAAPPVAPRPGDRLPVPVVDAGRRAARGPRPGRRRYGPLRAPRHSRGPPLRPRAWTPRSPSPPSPAAARCRAGARRASAGSPGCCCASCRGHAAEMERGVAAAAAERAQAVDYGLRIVAQEQVGLAYAGWDRLLTRVALPAWRMGRWPSRLDAGVVSALTELSRRDRLAEGFASRLGERPACDLLEEPGAVDEAASLLAARLFHGGPAEPGPDWSPVGLAGVSGRGRRPQMAHGRGPPAPRPGRPGRAAAPTATDPDGPDPGPRPGPPDGPGRTVRQAAGELPRARPTVSWPPAAPEAGRRGTDPGADAEPATTGPPSAPPAARRTTADLSPDERGRPHDDAPEQTEALAAAHHRRAGPRGSRRPAAPTPPGQGPDDALWDDGLLPLFPLQPPRTGRELLADHVTAMVCCAAVDTAGAAPGLDWLDGPALLRRRRTRRGPGAPRPEPGRGRRPGPLRGWLVRPGRPTGEAGPAGLSPAQGAPPGGVVPLSQSQRSPPGGYPFRSRQFATNGDGLRALCDVLGP